MPSAAVPPSAAPSADPPAYSHLLLVPIAALLTILPLLIHGTSCGHDQGFHLVSWFDAAAQLRHGHYPHWAVAPAWNAGEPRFLFYPPLSWLTGALLTMLLPAPALPIVYSLIVLTAAGFAMYRLAGEFVSPSAALLASAFYLANPYMLFNAFERSADAELLAAAWMPLLLLTVLRNRPTARGIAIPLALLWLTNAPAAVMGSYMLALLATLRVALLLYNKKCRHPERSAAQSKDPKAANQPIPTLAFQPNTLRLALTYIAGTALGLALPAFYLVPAAYERRFVQVDMAIIPNMRFQDNFLFDYTADAAHNGVNHSISLLAVAVLALTVLLIAALLILRKQHHHKSFISTGASPTCDAERRDLQLSTAIPLTLLTVIIAFLLFPISTPIWQHLPELAFLQFPWRLLTVLSVVLALTFALLLDITTTHLGAPSIRGFMRMGGVASTALALLLPLGLGFLLYAHTAQGCELRDRPSSIANSLATGHGVQATDEYTPTNADNDVLRTGNPGYWLAARPTDPAPGTVPTPTELNPAADTDDIRVPFDQTLSTPAPHHIQIHTSQPSYLVLNLRDYPAWQVTTTTGNPTHLQRNDGLIAIAVPAGNSTIDIHWHRALDQTLGLLLSAIALIVLLYPIFKSSNFLGLS